MGGVPRGVLLDGSPSQALDGSGSGTEPVTALVLYGVSAVTLGRRTRPCLSQAPLEKRAGSWQQCLCLLADSGSAGCCQECA